MGVRRRAAIYDELEREMRETVEGLEQVRCERYRAALLEIGSLVRQRSLSECDELWLETLLDRVKHVVDEALTG